MALETVACATEGCPHVIAVHPEIMARFRKTAENFVCPSGHSNYFPKKPSNQTQQIERLTQENNQQSRQISKLRTDQYMLLDLILDMAPAGLIRPGEMGYVFWKCPCGKRSQTHRPAYSDAEAEGRLRRHADRAGHQLPDTIVVYPQEES